MNYKFYNWLAEFHQDFFTGTKKYHSLDESQLFTSDIDHPNQATEDYHDYEYHLQGIIRIIICLQKDNPHVLHKYHGDLLRVINGIERNCVKPEEQEAKKYFRALNNIKLALSKLLEKYDYKNNPQYRANSSILFGAMLHERTKPLHHDNLSTDQIFIRTQIGAQRKNHSLRSIAERFRVVTGKEELNIQFISIGISADNQIYITSNYHTPTVFRLDDILSGREHFKNISDKTRGSFNLGRRVKSTYSGNIHAETMMAALKDRLHLDTVLVMSASGVLVQNCLYCCQYLADKGFFIRSTQQSNQKLRGAY